MTNVNLFTVGGIASIVYATVTLSFYTYLWIRWGNILKSGQANQILTLINRKSTEWPVIWWGITIIPHAVIPIFLAVLKALWKDEPALASMAFVAGIVALILGILAPLRCIAISKTLARIFAIGNDMQRAAAEVAYKVEESYGKGLYCLFGAT